MKDFADKIDDAANGVALAAAPTALEAIRDSACAAVVYRREVPRDALDDLAAIPAESLPQARVVLPPDSVASTVVQLCEIAGTPKGPGRDWLETDIPQLADLFAKIMDTKYLRLRLDPINTNACRKFHIDAITARLVCTYRGQATQYGTAEIGSEPEKVFQVSTGSPILLRGTRWPVTPAADLLHRSPPIEGTGETRLVLVLDPADSPGHEM